MRSAVNKAIPKLFLDYLELIRVLWGLKSSLIEGGTETIDMHINNDGT